MSMNIGPGTSFWEYAALGHGRTVWQCAEVIALLNEWTLSTLCDGISSELPKYNTPLLYTPWPRYVLIDTPGQIEVFTWSASGTIITEALVSVLGLVHERIWRVSLASVYCRGLNGRGRDSAHSAQCGSLLQESEGKSVGAGGEPSD